MLITSGTQSYNPLANSVYQHLQANYFAGEALTILRPRGVKYVHFHGLFLVQR